MSEQVLIDGKRVAYAAIPGGDMMKSFTVGICVAHEPGYRQVDGYGPYDEERCRGVVERLNKALGVDELEAAKIVASTFRGSRRPRHDARLKR